LQLSTVRFLVVEDHDVQRRLLIQILSNLGAVSIQDAEDGHAALRVMRDAGQPIDIMVTDLSMPGMDGIELIRHIGEGGSGVSLILTSALEPRLLASVANMAQAYKVKLLGMVKKPASAAKLAPLIVKYLADKAPPRLGDDKELAFAEIADAFVKDEFEPHYEPTVSLTDLKVKGLQAVPVWRHPVRGLLPAQVFMPAVKACGLGDDLVWLMLRKCAAQSAAWKKKGLELRVAVNLALGSLADLQLASRVEKVVLDEGAEAGSLMLGIGEEAVDVASARALENMVRLRVLGFELAIDEFGTGSMAVDQLARVAFNALKISRNFVSANPKARPLWAGLAAALDTAQQLKLEAVADGIATPDDWNLLQELQCHLGQGPLISPPVPGESVAQWLQTWPPRAQRGVWTPTLLT
jgi:EAL domain-containing protein (putative c-di-GMP-specific phosphodiesterase class I)